MESYFHFRLRTLMFIILWAVILPCRYGRSYGSSSFINPALKITYTNQFKFELKSDVFLGIVRELATESGFVYNGRIVAEFFLFMRDDIRKYSQEPYDIEKIQAALNRMSEYVISIVQDYIRRWDDSLWDNLLENAKIQNTQAAFPLASAETMEEHLMQQRTGSLNSKCGSRFDGISASCTIAADYAGQLRALRPCLSTRDIEHIMVRTARIDSKKKWRKNGAGRKFLDEIGFGELDLDLMLNAAKAWKHVPKVHKCEITPADTDFIHITGTSWKLKTTVVSDGCRTRANQVQYLEHVQVEMNLHCSQVFQVAIRLISPDLTVSNILTKTNETSVNSEPFQKLHWTFKSVNFWGELSYGLWDIEVIVKNSTSEVTCDYNVKKLILHGTATDPAKGVGPHTCPAEHVSENGSERKSVNAGVAVQILIIVLIMD